MKRNFGGIMKNKFASLLAGCLFVVFSGLGSWCLLTTSNVKAALPNYATHEYVEKKVDTLDQRIEKRFDRVDQQINRIYNKLDELDKFIRN